MPNNSYIRSTKRERELVNLFRKSGWDACRSAGSHSPWDVWAFNREKNKVYLVQVKTTKGARRLEKTLEYDGGNIQCWRFNYV